MCGIVGSINFKLNKSKAFSDLLHRGPDGNGIFKDGNVQLLHTRLAIQDIKHGSQPFILGDLVIVFNGEIYNHKEIRENHLKEFRFRTNSDTETLICLYHKYRESLFDLIDGMFAFAVYDKKNKELFLARDRSGKKPLYYFYDGKHFVFASELNVLRRQLNPKIDGEALEFFLRTGFFWNNTPYENVYEIEPGSFLCISTRNLKILKRKKYFNIQDIYQKFSMENLITNEKEARLLVEQSLKKSVYNRLVSSDVEVSAFLSGGIDSSLVVALARKYKKLQTFTVKFEGMYDESKIASKIAKYLNVPNDIVEISLKNLEQDIEEILLSYGKPFFDSSAIPSYYVSREAAKHTKVVLNGDGGDELFAGYRRYVPFRYEKILNFLKLIASIYKTLPVPTEKMSLYNYLYRLLKTIGKSGLSFYLSLTTDIFEDIYENWSRNKYMEALNDYIVEILSLQGLDFVQKLLILDFNIILPSDLLQKMDIATMKNSLEARSPFLSVCMIEVAAKLNTSLKIKGRATKYILRKLASRYLPKDVVNLPKRGFEIPLVKWVDGKLKKIMKHYVLDKPVLYPEFVSQNLVSRVFNRELKIAEDKRAKILWNLFTLEVWGQHV